MAAAGFENAVYKHPGDTACPVDLLINPDAQPVPVPIQIPIDKTAWQGVQCDACKLFLVAA